MKTPDYTEYLLQMVIANMGDGIIVINESGIIEIFNPACEKMFGYSAREAIGKNVALLMPPPHRERHDSYLAGWRQRGTSDVIGLLREFNALHKDGHEFPIEIAITEMRYMDKRLYAATVRDISDRKLSESIRDRLIQQLTEANEQLEQFAYVASHDLREPLRIVVSFSDLLAQEYGERIDGEGREYMAIMRQAAKKMEAMVADLLDYGRLGHQNERFVEVDCNKKLRQAREALAEAIRGSGAVIESDILPRVMANPLRFSRLLQNLISNALKYQRPGNPPHIRITLHDQGDCWRFAVADNGIGIAQEHLQSIFAPFKRLHSDREYAGTGIGLAICRRIVEGFGGSIWAESTPGCGSTFHFTVPKAEEGKLQLRS